MHDSAERHQSDGRLGWAVAVNVGLSAAQVVGGILSGSLSLIADALHNLNDAGALVIALLARRIARRPADGQRTFGYRRAEVVGALINLTSLVLVGLYLCYEALFRAFAPEPIAGWTVVWVAALALAVDLVTAALTFALSKESLNLRAVFVHNVSDALASLAVMLAGTLIILYGWTWADALATLLIAGYILFTGLSMMRDTIRILMESAPLGLDFEEVAADLATIADVESVHHLHAWQIDEHRHALEGHVVTARHDPEGMARIKREVRTLLAERFGIEHTTLELEHPSELSSARKLGPLDDCRG